MVAQLGITLNKSDKIVLSDDKSFKIGITLESIRDSVLGEESKANIRIEFEGEVYLYQYPAEKNYHYKHLAK